MHCQCNAAKGQSKELLFVLLVVYTCNVFPIGHCVPGLVKTSKSTADNSLELVHQQPVRLLHWNYLLCDLSYLLISCSTSSVDPWSWPMGVWLVFVVCWWLKKIFWSVKLVHQHHFQPLQFRSALTSVLVSQKSTVNRVELNVKNWKIFWIININFFHNSIPSIYHPKWGEKKSGKC